MELLNIIKITNLVKDAKTQALSVFAGGGGQYLLSPARVLPAHEVCFIIQVQSKYFSVIAVVEDHFYTICPSMHVHVIAQRSSRIILKLSLCAISDNYVILNTFQNPLTQVKRLVQS